jgi:type II secretory pathway pseudopilin PulG
LRVKARNPHGFALIDLIFVIGMISVLCMIALPRLLLARQMAGAGSALGSLRSISSAQLTYAFTCGGGFYAPSLSVLGTPPPGSEEAFISAGLTGSNVVTRSGYVIRLDATPFADAPPTCNGLGGGEAGQAFRAGADPTVPENPRYFAINANGQIYEHSSSLFASMPEVGDPPVGHILK